MFISDDLLASMSESDIEFSTLKDDELNNFSLDGMTEGRLRILDNDSLTKLVWYEE